MTEQISPNPIQPSDGRVPFVSTDPALGTIGSLRLVPRTLVAILMAIVGALTGFLGLILFAMDHWAAKAVGLTLVEPLALFVFCCCLYCLVPTSPLGRLMAHTYGRAKVAIWGVMFACALGTAVGLAIFTISRVGK
jgi:hypothetical protein